MTETKVVPAPGREPTPGRLWVAVRRAEASSIDLMSLTDQRDLVFMVGQVKLILVFRAEVPACSYVEAKVRVGRHTSAPRRLLFAQNNQVGKFTVRVYRHDPGEQAQQDFDAPVDPIGLQL